MKINYAEDFEEMITVEDICEHLKIEQKKAYALCRLDTFPAIKLGRSYIIPKRLYLKWLGENIGSEVLL